ncbi:MAG TPA: periplasmic heavy metal sensor [Pyrinomonadaceae bacterium]
MNDVTKSRWQVRLAALVIFVLGFTAGILALNVYRRWARDEGDPRDRIERLSQRLQLNEDQKTKMQQVFSDTREQLSALRKESEPKVNEIRRQADERMKLILTPEQWQQFQKMRDEMRHRRGGRGGPRGEGRP